MAVADGGLRAALVALSVASVLFLHECIHLAIGRLAGIPAAFTGLTSVGIPRADASLYAGWRLALMNGTAPLVTVLAGFVVLHLLARWQNGPERLRFFLSWWAIFGIPYLGLQLMIIVLPVDFSGNGVDSAAVAGYLNAQPWVLAVLSFAGFLWYVRAGRLVLHMIEIADRDAPKIGTDARIAAWRHVAAWGLLVIAFAGAMRFALEAFASRLPGGSLDLPAMLFGWSGACVLWTRWRSFAARGVWSGWLIPGAIGLLALVPLGFIGGGNDFAQLWLLELPPVFAATMLASDQRGIVAFTRPRRGRA